MGIYAGGVWAIRRSDASQPFCLTPLGIVRFPESVTRTLKLCISFEILCVLLPWWSQCGHGALHRFLSGGWDLVCDDLPNFVSGTLKCNLYRARHVLIQPLLAGIKQCRTQGEHPDKVMERRVYRPRVS